MLKWRLRLTGKLAGQAHICVRMHEPFLLIFLVFVTDTPPPEEPGLQPIGNTYSGNETHQCLPPLSGQNLKPCKIG